MKAKTIDFCNTSAATDDEATSSVTITIGSLPTPSFVSLLSSTVDILLKYIAVQPPTHHHGVVRPVLDMEASLVGSLPSLGAMAGSAAAGLLIDQLGRRRGGVVMMLPFAISWAIVEVSRSALPILIARFVSGVAGGACLVFAPIFISEVAEDSVRGTLASCPIVLYCAGAMFSYLLGWFSRYHAIVWVNLATSVLGVVLMGTVAESPVFLLKKNREEEARAAIAHYRGATSSSKLVLEEFSRLKHQLCPAVELITVTSAETEKTPEESEKEKLNGEETVGNQEKSMQTVVDTVEPRMPAWKMLYVSRSSSQAFKVVAIHLTMQVFMGIVPVQVYAKELFAAAAPDLSSNLCSVLFAIVLLGGSITTAAVADKTGRRFLLISSSVLVAIFMAALGFSLQTHLQPAWVAALLILLYCFSFNCGAGTVPYVLLAEVFVQEVQGLASMILIELVWFLNFVIIAVFPFVTKLLGIHGIFYIFAAMGVGNAILGYLIIPETKGLSNQEIQEAFLRRTKK